MPALRARRERVGSYATGNWAGSREGGVWWSLIIGIAAAKHKRRLNETD